MAKNAWVAQSEYFQSLKNKELDYFELKEMLTEQDLELYMKWLCLGNDFDDYLMKNGIMASDFAMEYLNT